MQYTGKLVVVSIFSVALVMAGLAWGWNYFRTQQTLKFWGREGTLLIRRGPQVKTFQIQPQSNPTADNLSILKEADISKAPGLINARQPLLDDSTFLWDDEATNTPATYTHGAEFRDGEKVQTLLFDFQAERILNLTTGKSVRGLTKIMNGWKKYSQSHLDPASASEKK